MNKLRLVMQNAKIFENCFYTRFFLWSRSISSWALAYVPAKPIFESTQEKVGVLLLPWKTLGKIALGQTTHSTVSCPNAKRGTRDMMMVCESAQERNREYKMLSHQFAYHFLHRYYDLTDGNPITLVQDQIHRTGIGKKFLYVCLTKYKALRTKFQPTFLSSVR